jgi:hypothetical protein
MGSVLKPASLSPQFADQTGLTWNILPAVIGLLVSPNRGLFVFSPLLLLLTALPWAWKEVPHAIRAVLTCLAPGMFLYFMLISRLLNWGAAGWGPRYLLPVFPALFVATCFVLARLWNCGRVWRSIASVIVLISCSLAIPAILVNHTAAIRADAKAIDPDADVPRQIFDTLHSLGAGLGELSKPESNAPNMEPTVFFPDLMATRVFVLLRGKSAGVASVFVGVYVITLVLVLYELLWRRVRRRVDPKHT